MFKTGMGITSAQSPVFLFNCLDSDLKDDILRANPGTEVAEMTEANLTDAIKALAVKVESKLVHRIRMGQTSQAPGTSIKIFHATLKGQSTPLNTGPKVSLPASGRYFQLLEFQ